MKRTIAEKFNSIPPEKLFLFLALIFGPLSVAILPILTGPDESAHFWISEAMFRSGDYTPSDLLVGMEGVRDSLDNHVYGNYFLKKVDFEGAHFAIAIQKIGHVSYLPQGLGILFGKLIYPSLGVMVIMGRLFNLTFYVFSGFQILKRVKYGKLVFLFISLIPMMIQQAGSLSYDVINIVVILAFFALMINLFTQEEILRKRQLLVLLGLVLLLCITKQSNVVLLLFLPFLPKRLYITYTPFRQLSERIRPKQRALIIVGIVVLVVLGVVFIGGKVLSHYNETPVHLFKLFLATFGSPNSNPILDNTITTGIWGNFSWLLYWFPEWFILIEASTLLLIFTSEQIPQVSRTFALVSAAIFVLSILIITFGMYFFWTLRPDIQGDSPKYIEGMQGRYFTPLLVLLFPIFAYLQKYIKVQSKYIRLISVSIIIVALLYYLALTVVYFY